MEIGEAVGCQDLKIDFRMLLGELRQKRNKPFRRESRRDADSEMDRLRPKVSCRAVDQLKCPANVRGITSSFTGQRKRFGEPFEQLETDFCFQPLMCCETAPGSPRVLQPRRGEVARSHFEGAERIERGIRLSDSGIGEIFYLITRGKLARYCAIPMIFQQAIARPVRPAHWNIS